MVTHRLYYDDSYLQTFTAHVLSCVPAGSVAGASGPQSAWKALLDRTAFYPSSGGQPNDTGKLDGAAILDVRDDGEEIAHIVDREVTVGNVEGHVNWERRFDHMQQHTGQHLLSAMFQERFGLPTASFHLGEDVCTIDLRGREPSADVLRGAQRAANAIVFEDRPIHVRYGTAEQLAERGVRKEVDREGTLRAIEIQGADLQPCGGTHVKSTGQIGLILVRRCTKIRQDWRVEFMCGARAERVATNDFSLLRSIGEQLSCGQDETLASMEKILAERDASFKNYRAAIQQLAEARAQLLVANTPPSPDGLYVIARLLDEDSAELLLPLASELAKNEKTVALLVHAGTGKVVFAQSPSAGKDLSTLLRQVLATVPGKGGGSRDFVRGKLSEPGRSSEALALALRELA
jgi:alanyl-tRNA synthetase